MRNRVIHGWRGWLAGLAVLLVSLFVLPPSTGFVNAFEPGKNLIWALLLAVLARLAARSRTQPTSWFLLGGALLLWMIGRTLARPLPLREITVLAGWLMPLLFLLVAARLEPDEDDHMVLGWLLLVAGGIQATLMLLQYAGLDPFFSATTGTVDYRPARMIGTIGYQNQAAEFLALSLAGLFLLRRITLSAGLLSSVILFAVLLTANRGCILGLAVAGGAVLICVGLSRQVSRRRLVVMLGGAVSLMVLAVALMPATRSRLWEVVVAPQESAAVASRLNMARMGLEMIRERPLVGWGAGEYAYQYLERLGGLLPAEKSIGVLASVVYAREAHNDAIQFGAEFGLPALVVAGCLLVLLLVSGLRQLRPDAGREQGGSQEPEAASSAGRRMLAALVIHVIVFMSVTSSFSFTWQTCMAGPMAGLLLGWNAGGVSRPSVLHNRLHAFFSVFATVCVLGLLLLHARALVLEWRFSRAMEQGDLNRAERVIGRHDYRHQALLGAAFAKAGELERAGTHLESAIQGWQDVLLFNNLGHVYAAQGRWRGALPVYQAWARTGIRHDEALWNLAITHERLGDLQSAAATRLRKHALFPKRSKNEELMQTVVLLVRVGKLDSAQTLLAEFERRCARVQAGWTAEWENLAGALLLRRQQPQAAAQRFRRALKMNPALESARRNLDNLERSHLGPPLPAGN